MLSHCKTIVLNQRSSRGDIRDKSFLSCCVLLCIIIWQTQFSQIPVLWLVLSQSGFCSTDRFHGNGPIRVFLFWSESGKFKICNQNSENKKCEYCHSSHWNYQKKLERRRLKVFRNFRDGWRRRTFLSASHRKCILLSQTECHIINNLLT